MRKDAIITAIDIGTDKCVTLISTLNKETNKLRVVGVCAVPSKGIKRSVIVDLEKVLGTISESLDGAERMAGFEVHSAFVAVSGSHIHSLNSKGVVAVAEPEGEISHQDVSRVIEAARAVSLPQDQEIIHVIPKNFKVDSQPGIKDPLGMTGVRLEAEAHIITGMGTSLRNIKKCMSDLGLKVDGFVFSALAGSQVVLSETEKELGVVIVDIGAGTTNICAFVEGSLEFSGAIPVGAGYITQDIALGTRISLENAEKIKLALSEDMFKAIEPRPGESKEDLSKRRKKADKLKLDQLGIHESVEELSKRTIVEGIMGPRMKEIIEEIAIKLDDHDLLDKVPAGVVFTGGGSQTVGLTNVARKILRLPARIGYPVELDGLISDIKEPSYATSIGLLVYAQHNLKEEQFDKGLDLAFLKNLNLGGISKIISNFIKKMIP